jgi:L-serine dehydratase
LKYRVSLLNHVLGPVMRGPSSSHSAAPYFIARMVRELSISKSNGDKLIRATIRFDQNGSFASVYASQGADEGFAAGLCGYDMMSPAYLKALQDLKDKRPFDFTIEIGNLIDNYHPNRVDIILTCQTANHTVREDTYQAVSTGGGMFNIFSLNGQQTSISGETGLLIIEGDNVAVGQVESMLEKRMSLLMQPISSKSLPLTLKTRRFLTRSERSALTAIPGIKLVRETSPKQLLMTLGDPLFYSSDDFKSLSENQPLHEIIEQYESRMLGLPTPRIRRLFRDRLRTMLHSVSEGLEIDEHSSRMKYIKPSAANLASDTSLSRVAGEPVYYAICGSLAVMELTTNRGIICAAPTAGSAGILPGCLHSLARQGYTEEKLVRTLEVAALIGAIIAMRATFAAETCGCMAETGSAAAMAAGGIAYIHGATTSTIFDAASLCLMNTLGLICDPIKGEVEIPCHSRNILGVGNAYTAATSVVGGFKAALPFEEIVDTMVAVGKKTCPEFRCTARGGLATTPTASKL